jgi:hypothetical protein
MEFFYLYIYSMNACMHGIFEAIIANFPVLAQAQKQRDTGHETQMCSVTLRSKTDTTSGLKLSNRLCPEPDRYTQIFPRSTKILLLQKITGEHHG